MKTAFEQRNEVRVVPAIGGESELLTQGFYPSWSHDGRRIAFWFNAIYLMERESGERSLLVPDDRVARGPLAWSPDGRFIAFNGVSEIYVASVRDGATVHVTTTGWLPSWSPWGDKIIFVDAYAMWAVEIRPFIEQLIRGSDE